MSQRQRGTGRFGSRRAICLAGWVAAGGLTMFHFASEPAPEWVPLYPVCFEEGHHERRPREMKLPTTERFHEAFRRYMEWSDIRPLYRKSDGLLLIEKSVRERNVVRLADSALTGTASALAAVTVNGSETDRDIDLVNPGLRQWLDCSVVEAIAVRDERPAVRRQAPAE